MILGIPVYEGVDVLDVMGPFELLNWAGFDVQIAAVKAGPIKCRGGAIIVAPLEFRDAPQYGALWVPGGDPNELSRMMYGPDQTYIDFITGQAEKAHYVCSVCEGALLLAAAGLLDGYEATTHWAFAACMGRFPKVKLVPGHPRFVIDRNRITGGGISSGLDEALKVIELLQGTQAAQDAQRNTQYYPCPPVSSTIPDTPPACIVPKVTIPPPKGAA